MILVRTMQGLGDAFAARPTVAALLRKHHEIAVETAWPEVFADLTGAIHFLKPSLISIRCAQRNADESKLYDERWRKHAGETVQLGYHLAPGCKSIPEQIAESAGFDDSKRPPFGREADWRDLFVPTIRVIKTPDLSESEKLDIIEKLKNARSSKCIVMPRSMEVEMKRVDPSPLAVFRVPTARIEYMNLARMPEPGLVAFAVDEIGGDWIHLNDMRHKHSFKDNYESASDEEFIFNTKYADASSGQLSIPTCLDLVSRARCVVTPVSWMLWSAVAYGTPCLALFGGYASPRTILGPILDLATNLKVLTPEPGCWCFDPSHNCQKDIPIERVREAAKELVR